MESWCSLHRDDVRKQLSVLLWVMASVRGFVTDVPGEGLVKDMDQVPLVEMATIVSTKDHIKFLSKIHFRS